jgi:hypothetical protein
MKAAPPGAGGKFMDLGEYSDEELLEAGREAVKREQWANGASFMSAYVDRWVMRGQRPPAGAIATFALCLGHTHELRRGLDLAKRAQVSDPRNPNVYWCLAQLHLLGGFRREAIETVERGLRAAPDNFILLRMRKRLGVRQPTPLPFLARGHRLNVSIGRLMHRLRGNAA